MKYIDLSDTIASGMDAALNSEENKQMFSSSSVLEKLAFKKVSEQDATTEIELELEESLTKTASCCECEESKKADACKCECHEKKHEKSATTHSVRDSFNDLLKVSATLDAAGFERLAAASAMLADRLLKEAKEKSKSKSDDKKSKKDSDKSKGKKPDMKERMKKMREMQKGKKDKKDSKKSDKK